MRLNVVRDIAARQEAVFDRIVDFARFEERARARGAEVRPLAVERGWHVGFDWHGMRREVDLILESLTRPEGYTARLETNGLKGHSAIEVIPLAPDRSRLSINCTVEAASLPGRLMMQPLAFARPALEARLAGRLDELAAELEARS